MPRPARRRTLPPCSCSCPDRRGIVAALAQLLLRARREHPRRRPAHRPRRRPVLPAHPLRPDRARAPTASRLERAIREVAERFAMRWQLAWTRHARKRVAIFVSRYDHCLYDLLLRHRAGELRLRDRADREQPPRPRPVADAVRRAVPASSRSATETQGGAGAPRARRCSTQERIDLVVLARYMQVLSGELHRALPRPHHQHPPLVPARLHGRQALPPGRASAASS